MFPYLICAVCPLVGEYEPGNPICGFLFPAFVDRSGDLERVDIYAERAAWGDADGQHSWLRRAENSDAVCKRKKSKVTDQTRCCGAWQ